MSQIDVQTQSHKDLMRTLREIGGGLTGDEDVTFEGTRFVLPTTMSLKGAVKYLLNKVEQEEQLNTYVRDYRYRPWDGAHALQAALRKNFGGYNARASESLFGSKPPALITIPVGVTETEQIPWGDIEIPLFEGTLTLGGYHDEDYGLLFRLVVNAPRKFRHEIEGLFRVVEHELATNSIYRGKAINGRQEAEFIDLSGVDPAKVVYSREVLTQLDANVWSLLEHTEAMRRLGVPLKRAVLLEGPYGTGKTLAAFLTARKAVENDWTFIYCRPAKDDLGEVLATARLYQPALVFFEDVDTVAETGDHDAVTRLLDMFDGITAKGTEILAVLTTNHPERIHKGMVRPGRLDAVIHIGELDHQGVADMIHALVPSELLGYDLDFDVIADAMDGFLPAFVKEAIDRAMRYAIARTEGEPVGLETGDFVAAAHGLIPQLELMHGAKEGTVAPTLDKAFSSVLTAHAVDAGPASPPLAIINGQKR